MSDQPTITLVVIHVGKQKKVSTKPTAGFTVHWTWKKCCERGTACSIFTWDTQDPQDTQDSIVHFYNVMPPH
jgi:hypothetical protein